MAHISRKSGSLVHEFEKDGPLEVEAIALQIDFLACSI